MAATGAAVQSLISAPRPIQLPTLQAGMVLTMKEVYWEIKINKPGPRFLPELSLSGPAKVVYFDLPIYFLHASKF